jgi:hypothetical protein
MAAQMKVGRQMGAAGSTMRRRNSMLQQAELAGSFTLPGTSMTVNRMGYGAMQLAGRKSGDRRATSTRLSRFCGRRLTPA